jgi:N-formylglutamate deformylase
MHAGDNSQVETYQVKVPAVPRVPILVSIPHCGTEFPPELHDEYDPALIEEADDTDWFVDRLYSFAPSMGITMISAVMSRWVIDLNRHPQSKPLYTDGRIITDLCPTTTFLGQALYKDRRTRVDPDEVIRRTQLYFTPYHEKLQEILSDLKFEFGQVLLWDCHSIRQSVSTIQKEKFPDLILGSADGLSASAQFIQSALQDLRSARYSVSHNHSFKGGYITRRFGNPGDNQHALQLEMSKINYMDDLEKGYHSARAGEMAELLYYTLSNLARRLVSHKDY